ncbi:hypothetical protein P168DRAFT_63650 [Aspergillus campestris IBT 28561]|uniref:Uncharacterized protein n=1 Tax=Aspergillus campestris (strain IBT 28561) TaxID=1392248 RepID=A0A2I1CSW4_ASPC2|nr:uncharacterized protein P168DRAFT_63650 [Aspergillus campestris IBT 28561]PKY00708.1 hypothetical protein P168DRAFT_63650 [Aspergillus campestris IBT 28561]
MRCPKITIRAVVLRGYSRRSLFLLPKSFSAILQILLNSPVAFGRNLRGCFVDHPASCLSLGAWQVIGQSGSLYNQAIGLRG